MHALAVRAKANAPKVPSSANAVEKPAATAGRVTCHRPILARVAGVTQRVTCRLFVSMVRHPYPSLWGDFQTVTRPVEVHTVTDRSLSTSSANYPRGARLFTLDFPQGASPRFLGLRPPSAARNGGGGGWVSRRVSDFSTVETFPMGGQSRKSIEEFFGRLAKKALLVGICICSVRCRC
jgi:hypothetical protein